MDVQIAAMNKADDAAQKTIKLQKETTELDERPYVNVVPDTPTVFSSSGYSLGKMTFQTKLRIITSGRTPALGMRLTFRCLQSLDPIGVDFGLINPPTFAITIKALTNNPGEPRPFAYLSTAGEQKTNMCRVDLPDKVFPQVVILGHVDYSDYFKVQHHTSFCYYGRFTDMPHVVRHIYIKSYGRIPFFTVEPIDMFTFEQCPLYNATFD